MSQHTKSLKRLSAARRGGYAPVVDEEGRYYAALRRGGFELLARTVRRCDGNFILDFALEYQDREWLATLLPPDGLLGLGWRASVRGGDCEWWMDYPADSEDEARQALVTLPPFVTYALLLMRGFEDTYPPRE